jgi:amylosucrase
MSKQLLFQLFDSLYPNQADATQQLSLLIQQNSASKVDTPWYQKDAVVAMTLYVDRFAGSLQLLQTKVEYFQQLGINLIHLMPLLKTREEENDGGYAVVDFNDVDPRFGTMDDLKSLIELFHQHHIKVMIDFVLNHVAKEHEWAQKAMTGDQFYERFFMMYDDDIIPKQFDETVPLVLPEKKATNFTYYPNINKYVYTSFSEFQWDLNFKNPYVLIEILKQITHFKDLGLDMIRLDAIPFMWKTIGTNCRNLPEVHILMRIIRIFRDLVAPQLGLLGEAIVEPHEIVKYFGTDDAPECDYMYNANLMVDLWNTIATQDARLLLIDQNRFNLPKHATWLNYIRCHDDIGWGFNEEAISSMGFDPFAHKQFLISFFNGTFSKSFSKGIDYQKNEKTHDARTNGMMASLIGIEDALDQKSVALLQLSMSRFNMLNSILMFYQGAPMMYAGDDIAMINDTSYLQHDVTKGDSRWLHRPFYDWQLYKAIQDVGHPLHGIHKHIKKLTSLRNYETLLNPMIPQQGIFQSDANILILYKSNQNESLIGVFNVSDHVKHLNTSLLRPFLTSNVLHELLQGRKIDATLETLMLAPYESLWIKS